MLESSVEAAVCRIVKGLGGVCWKWVSPGRVGVPDRICILPGPVIIFVELKRPGRNDGRSESQKKVFRILKDLGCEVWLIDNANTFREKLLRRLHEI